MKKEFVSVIVPTYRDWTRMALCIEALRQQTYQAEWFEVLIVNNDPSDPPPADLNLPAHFTHLTEAKPGSYAARNTGLKKAKGNIIGFTDADCVPHKDWIENAVAHLAKNANCARVAGHISIMLQGKKPTLAESYNAIFAFPQQSHASSGTCVTGNMFTHRHVFDAVGVFNENLLSLGDLEWGKRANRAGYAIQYVRNVVIEHPARTFPDLVKKEKRVGGGQASMMVQGRMRTLISCINDVRPRFRLLKKIYKQSDGANLLVQLRVFMLRHYLIFVRATEKYRVIQGKQPERA